MISLLGILRGDIPPESSLSKFITMLLSGDGRLILQYNNLG